MDINAQTQLGQESVNWLNRSRTALLSKLVAKHTPKKIGPLQLLEVGAGFGQNVSALVEHGEVDVVEVSPSFLEHLRRTDGIRDVYTDGVPQLSLDRKYDVICAMDVLEHIEDDRGAIAWIYEHLNPNGVFIATVPAYQWMFSDHDRANQHFRRYTRPVFSDAIRSRLRIEQSSYFNMCLFPLALSVRALWSARKIFNFHPDEEGKREKQSSQVPKAVDAAFGYLLGWESGIIASGRNLPFGLSIICVACRND